MDPPPLPLRNYKTKLSFDSLPKSNPPPVPPHSRGVPRPYLVRNNPNDLPPIPPSPITDNEVALYHQRQSVKSFGSNPVRDTRIQSAVNNDTGSLKFLKSTKNAKEDFTQSCKLSSTSNNEVQIMFGKEQITYSFEEDKHIPKEVNCQQEYQLPRENKNDVFVQPIPPPTDSLLKPSTNSSPQSKRSYNYLTTVPQEDFNACSPPNDLLAACLNELSELQGFSQNKSESDSVGSNFSLQELSQLNSPIPDVESTDSLLTSVKYDDIGIEDLDALIADLDEMTQAIQTNSESDIQPTNSSLPNLSSQNLDTPVILNYESKPTNSIQQFHQHHASNLGQLDYKDMPPAVDLAQSSEYNDSKQAKISLALSKLKRANQKRVVLKIYDINMSYKMVIIDGNMTSRSVCSVMAEKNHQIPGPNWCLVELLGSLGLERTIEDHERVLDVLSHWPRQHSNVIIFKNISEKYLLLKKPQLFMPSIHPLSNDNESNFDDTTRRRILIKELFYDKTLPPIANVVNIKIGKKGSWRKIYCILRTSGLYYSKSRRPSTKDMVNLVTWKNVGLYKGQRYCEMYKSPEKFCCSLIPSGPLDQIEKSIVHLSFSNKKQLESWMACISLAKYSTQLFNNYLENFDLYPWLENGGELANAESESVSAVTPRSQESALTNEEKQMLHNELQMNSLSNPLIDSLDVLDEKKNKLNQSFDSELRDSVRKSSKIAATFSNAWVAGDSVSSPLNTSNFRNLDNTIDRQQPFSYTQNIPLPTKFTLV